MKLRIKEEYKDWSFGGGKLNKIRLSNLHPSLYEEYYKIYPDFFTIIEDKKVEVKKVENKEIKDDTNK